MKISFIVYGEPFGKQNMKPIIRGGHPVSIQTKGNTAYMQQVKYAFIESCGEMFDDHDSLRVTISAYKSIPKSTSKKKAELMRSGAILPTTKPDLDNISKVVLDSLTGLAYRDDAQVSEEHIYKFYSDIPRVKIVIENIGGNSNGQ